MASPRDQPDQPDQQGQKDQEGQKDQQDQQDQQDQESQQDQTDQPRRPRSYRTIGAWVGLLLLHSFETVGFIVSAAYAIKMKNYFSAQDMASDEAWARFILVVACLGAGSAAVLLLSVRFRVRRWKSRAKQYNVYGSFTTMGLILILMFELTATVHALMWVPRLLPNGPQEVGKSAPLLAIMMSVLMSLRAIDIGLFVLVDHYLSPDLLPA